MHRSGIFCSRGTACIFEIRQCNYWAFWQHQSSRYNKGDTKILRLVRKPLLIIQIRPQEFFWEAELAVVIGKSGKNIDAKTAKDYIFGYTVANDITALDWHRKNGGQWLLGKTMDGFCPLGPSILTTDKVPDPHNLAISCRVNGEIKQSSNTNQLIHGVYDCVAFLSK